jgi:hypothetical protein
MENTQAFNHLKTITTMGFDSRLRKVHIDIHRALHDVPYVTEVEVPGGKKAITMNSSGLRQVLFGPYIFVQQNPNKASKHAQRAREGAKITWGIIQDSPWLYIDDEVATAFTEAEFNRHDPIKDKPITSPQTIHNGKDKDSAQKTRSKEESAG